MERRLFLSGALGATALALAGCAPEPKPIAAKPPTVGAPVLPATHVNPAPEVVKVPLPGGPIYQLPGDGNFMAWTVDDGSSREAIEAYADFAEETGNRVTYFVTAQYPAWQEAAPRLIPLIESGQVQVANHTVNHPSLQKLTYSQIQQELMACNQFILDTFGVDPRPFYRPTFGNRDARTDAAAAAVGYTAPVMWYGTLGDAARKTPAEVVALANQWFLPQRIVIGHVNYVGGVTAVFNELNQIIVERNLQTVTLNDYFSA